MPASDGQTDATAVVADDSPPATAAAAPSQFLANGDQADAIAFTGTAMQATPTTSDCMQGVGLTARHYTLNAEKRT